jgi:DNA polymerase-1
MPYQASPEELANSLFLVDGSALAYRSHFAMAASNLSSPGGVPTGATYGFTMELKRLLDKVGPRYVAVVMDTSAPTFRHAAYPAYKATRQKMPPDLVEQIPWLKEASRALGIPVLELDGYEADDIMGTLAIQAAAQEVSVFLVTGDKDFMQLLSDRVRMYNIMKPNVELLIQGPQDVEEKFGVTPDHVIDVLALMGDSSDNVPGVPGIGEKTAKKLIQKHGTLEKLLADPGEDISPRLRKSLEEHGEQGRLSKRLVTIDTHVPVNVRIEDLAWTGPDKVRGYDLFSRLGFRALAAEMAEAPTTAVDARYEIVRDETTLRRLIEHLEAAPLFAVDTETTGLNARRARLVGCSFSCEDGKAWYVPLNLDPPVVKDPPGTPRGTGVVDALRPLLENPAHRKAGQNVKYDLLILRGVGIALQGVETDTMIAAYLLEPHERERSLDALTLRHFRHVKIKTEELIGKGKDQLTMDLLPVDDVGEYACEDADFTYRLAHRFLDRLDREDLRKLHDEVELPLIEVLADMEETGVRVDREKLRSMARGLEGQVNDLEERIREMAGGIRFNVNSPRQLGEVLFDQLEIHKACGFKPKKTQTGWATGQNVLEALSSHPLPALILEHRSLSKLLNTYVSILPGLVDPEDNRIHASFNQTVAATGRLSSSDPNLQNIPIRTEAGRRIREAFIPTDDDSVLLSADYSQVELRIMAHLSEDESLILAFKEGADIHRDTASRVFGIPRDEVDATMRGRAKAINFGILYGMGAQRLSQDTGLSRAEAKAFIERYFAAFPAVRGFLQNLKDEARREGFARTILGRRRPIPDINSSSGMLRSQAENMAVNTPIQGSAADILKVAMARTWRQLRDPDLKTRMILTVHDELVFDVPKVELDRVMTLVRSTMEGAYPLRVPLVVDMGFGRNWLEAH